MVDMVVEEDVFCDSAMDDGSDGKWEAPHRVRGAEDTFGIWNFEKLLPNLDSCVFTHRTKHRTTTMGNRGSRLELTVDSPGALLYRVKGLPLYL